MFTETTQVSQLYSQNFQIFFRYSRNWLLQVSAQLDAAHESKDKTEEFIQGIRGEIKMLLHRCHTLTKIQDRRKIHKEGQEDQALIMVSAEK